MIEIQLNTEINKSAEECWTVFGVGYTDIYKWKSDITSSDGEGGPFGDSPVGSRKVETSKLNFSEKLLHFSNSERAFTYQVLGLPFVVSNATNVWNFSESEGKATLNMHLKLQVTTGFGWLLGGLLRKNMTKEMGKLHQEFKYYMENGEVHPRKAKELAKK